MDSTQSGHAFVSQPPEDYFCSICTRVMCDPHLTDCCGQHFCRSCLLQWFHKQGRRQCPHCRNQSLNHIIDLPLKRKINELDVYCPNKGVGCDFQLKLGQISDHLQKCEYTQLTCQQGCGSTVYRKDLESHHSNKCPKRKFVCPYCSVSGCYDHITTDHRKECPEFPVGCPRQCSSKRIKRKELPNHKRVCPLEPVTCTFCRKSMVRQKIQAHRQNDCPRRPVLCEFCSLGGPHNEITGPHVAKCSEYPVGCPRKCDEGKHIKRKDAPEHTKVCLLEPVNCAFFDSGCRTTLPRKDIATHMESNTQQHLQYCMAAQQNLVQSFNAQYQSLVHHFSALTAAHDHLQADHTKLKDDYQKTKTALKAAHDQLQADHTKLKDKYQKTETELKSHQSCDFIRTMLSPNLTLDNSLSFRVPVQKCDPAVEKIWTSTPFTLDATCRLILTMEYKVKLKDSQFHSRTGYNIKIGLSILKQEFGHVFQMPSDRKRDIHVEFTQVSTQSKSWFTQVHYGYGPNNRALTFCSRCCEGSSDDQTTTCNHSVYGDMHLVDTICKSTFSESPSLTFTLRLARHDHCYAKS